MDTPMRKELTEDDPEFWVEFEAELMAMDESESQRHLDAGRPIYVCDDDTPAGCVIKIHPDGRQQLVRYNRDGDEVVSEL